MAFTTVPVLSSTSDTTSALTASWTERLNIPATNFVSGHTYFFIATAMLSDALNSAMSSAKVVFGAVDQLGTRNGFHTSGSSSYRHVFACGFINGSNAGTTGLSFQFMTSNVTYAGNVTKLKMYAIDLNVIPNDNTGWTSSESSTSVTLSASWQNQLSVNFTADGVSDYLIIGSVELSGFKSSGYSYSRMRVDSGTNAPQNKALALTSGGWNSASLMEFLSAPSAGSHTVTLEGLGGAGYDVMNYGRVLILRLNGFRSHAKAQSWASYTYNDTNAHYPVSSGEASPFPIVAGRSYFILRKIEPRGWSTSYGCNTWLEAAGDSTQFDVYSNYFREPQGSAEGSICLAHQLTTFAGMSGGVKHGVINQSASTPVYYNPAILAFELSWGSLTYEDAAAASSIATGASAAVIRDRDAAASSSIATAASSVFGRLRGEAASSGISLPASATFGRLRGAASAADILVGAAAAAQRLRGGGFGAPITVLASARVVLASSMPLPAISRGFSADIQPSEFSEVALVGNDDTRINNRLVVLSASQLGIDPLFSGIGTRGHRYTFAGPPDPLSDPIQLGFKAGDKIRLKQAVGQPAGPNNNRVFTIYDPVSLSVLETVTIPDTTSYKFYAIRRGA